jgi:hypothetical protein
MATGSIPFTRFEPLAGFVDHQVPYLLNVLVDALLEECAAQGRIP